MNGGSYGSISVHLGSDARIHCHTYRNSGPILAISAGDMGVTVTATKHEHMDEGDVTNARALATAVTLYLAECERVFNQTHPQEADMADEAAGTSAESTAEAA